MPLSNFRSSPVRPSAAPRSTGRRRRRRFAPDLLALETRALLSTLTVTNDKDSGSGSLRYELSIAQPNDIIDFSPKAYGTITLTSGPLPVPNGVDVQGPGASKVAVSGDDRSTVFEIGDGVTASISGLTITDGKASVVDNYGYIDGGGGIYSLGDLTLSDCVVTGNTAPPGGGGIFSNAVPYAVGTLTIADCTISGNSASEGGGIEAGGPLTITGSTISGNSAGAGGGIEQFVSDASLTNSSVADNTGGGIAINGFGTTPAPTLTVTDSTIKGNSGAVFGGGIGSLSANVTVSGSFIADNTSTNYPGGGLALGGGIDMSGNLFAETPGANILTITGTTFVGNLAASANGTSGGGAIYADSYSTISVTNSSFTDNIASSADQSQGGALQFDTLEQGTITDCTFTGNQAVRSSSPYTSGYADGGAIDNSAEFGPHSPLTITGSTFTDNLAQAGAAQGGAILNGSGGSTLTLSSDLLIGNRAVGTTSFASGGGLSSFFGATTNISDSSFLNNSAVGGDGGFASGGAIDDEAATLTVTGSLISGNSAIGGNAVSGSAGGNALGGAIRATGPLATLDDDVIVGNQAVGGSGGGKGIGGGIESGYPDSSSSLEVSGGVIAGNSAIGGSGGGDGEGGGVAVSGGTAAFTDVLITLNSAIGGTGGGKGYGGGIYIGAGALTTLTNTVVLGNFASTADNNIYGPYTGT